MTLKYCQEALHGEKILQWAPHVPVMPLCWPLNHSWNSSVRVAAVRLPGPRLWFTVGLLHVLDLPCDLPTFLRKMAPIRKQEEPSARGWAKAEPRWRTNSVHPAIRQTPGRLAAQQPRRALGFSSQRLCVGGAPRQDKLAMGEAQDWGPSFA